MINLKSPSGKTILVDPEAIEAMFEGTGKHVFQGKPRFCGAMIVLSCGKEIDVMENQTQINEKL